MSDSFVTPWTIAHHAPLSMGIFRQVYWSGLSFPSPEDFPNPRIKLTCSALQEDSLPLSHQKSAYDWSQGTLNQFWENTAPQHKIWCHSCWTVRSSKCLIPQPNSCEAVIDKGFSVSGGVVNLQGFPGSSASKESTCIAGDASLLLGWEDLLEKR